jgi:hypothetical protein
MDNQRDSSGQINSKQELQREMERTRQSLSETVGEIRGEISEALDWQTYLKRYPGAFLIGGGALGFIIGRALTGSASSRGVRNIHEQAAVFDREQDFPPKLSFEDSGLRRVIDMTASALLAQVVPILSSKLRNLLGIHSVEGRGSDSPHKDSWLH